MRRVARGLADRGISVATFDFPYIEAGRRVPDRGPALEAAFETAWRHARASASEAGLTPAAFLAGGKSMGGRIASQAAARALFNPSPAGLVFFGYPLHPPGRPENRRDSHLPEIEVPMLFVQGTRDPFATPDEIRTLTAALPSSALHLVDGGDHSLSTPRREDPDATSLDRALDATAAWVTAHMMKA
jgi:predicted alpha/beta-hydrolase family hydrolase